MEDTENVFLRRRNWMKADSTVLRRWRGVVLCWDQCRSQGQATGVQLTLGLVRGPIGFPGRPL